MAPGNRTTRSATRGHRQQQQQDLAQVAADQGARLAEAAKQLRTLEDQVGLLQAALPPSPDHTPTLARLNVSLTILRTLLNGAPTAPPPPPPPPPFPLLDLPQDVRAKICRMAPSAPAIRLTCKALHAALPANHLRPIQSPDQTDATFAATLCRPACLAALTSLDLSRVPDHATHRNAVQLAATHATALASITLNRGNHYPDLAPATAPTLRTLIILRTWIDSLSVLTSLASLSNLRHLALSLDAPKPFYRTEESDPAAEAASLLAPIATLDQLTRLELTLNWTTIDPGLLTAATLPLIAAALPHLAHLSLLPAAPWDDHTLAHLATLTALTALGLGHSPAPEAAPHQSSFFSSLAALPDLVALDLHLPASTLHAITALFQPSPTPQHAHSLSNEGGGSEARLHHFTSALGTAPALTHLAIKGRLSTTYHDLKLLAKSARSLRSLSLQGLLRVPDTLLTMVARLNHLTALTLLDCSGYPSPDMRPLPRLRKLEALTTDLVQGCGSMEVLGKLTRLTSLVLHGWRGHSVQQLVHLTTLHALRHLDFEGSLPMPVITDGPAFYSILMQLPALQRCTHSGWSGDKACCAEDIRRRFAMKTITSQASS